MIFNEIFNHIYVINLKDSLDRKEHIQNEFKRVGIINYEFFEATPYNSDEVINITKSNLVHKFPTCFRCNKNRCDCGNNFLTPYQIGNWCSFLKLFQDIINNDYKFVLICEDDVVFSHQYKRIINKLLSKSTFQMYNINMNKPLLIRLGTAFNPDNHNSNANPSFLKNFSLCNPCFAINKEMAIVYLNNLKKIKWTSDVYFHQIIPKTISGIQYFTMYPYPVYELSFVKSMQKFESKVRPNGGLRRIEYKEYLFLSSNFLLHMLCLNLMKVLSIKLDIKSTSMGFNGNIDYYLTLNENDKMKFYFKNKILLLDEDDINIKLFDKFKHMSLYKSFNNYDEYKNMLFDNSNIIININNKDDLNKLSKLCNPNKLNSLLSTYIMSRSL